MGQKSSCCRQSHIGYHEPILCFLALFEKKQKFELDVLETNKKGPHNTKEGEMGIVDSRMNTKEAMQNHQNK